MPSQEAKLAIVHCGGNDFVHCGGNDFWSITKETSRFFNFALVTYNILWSSE